MNIVIMMIIIITYFICIAHFTYKMQLKVLSSVTLKSGKYSGNSFPEIGEDRQNMSDRESEIRTNSLKGQLKIDFVLDYNCV